MTFKFVPASEEEIAQRVGAKAPAQETVRVRARGKKGQFQADDPNTPENEAWVEKSVKE
jgi:hypothetical protein